MFGRKSLHVQIPVGLENFTKNIHSIMKYLLLEHYLDKLMTILITK